MARPSSLYSTGHPLDQGQCGGGQFDAGNSTGEINNVKQITVVQIIIEHTFCIILTLKLTGTHFSQLIGNNH